MIAAIGEQEWVSYIEPPPAESSRPEHVVRYLTRYLTGGPISDHRILAADDREVTFLAREGNTVGGEQVQVPCTLETVEFVRRWCLHVQPAQRTKTRSFGGWSNTRVDGYLEHCAKLLDAAAVAIHFVWSTSLRNRLGDLFFHTARSVAQIGTGRVKQSTTFAFGTPRWVKAFRSGARGT